MERNVDIKRTAKSYGVKLWEIAEECGCSDVVFSKKLRKEFTPEEKKRIFDIIEQLKSKR